MFLTQVQESRDGKVCALNFLFFFFRSILHRDIWWICNYEVTQIVKFSSILGEQQNFEFLEEISMETAAFFVGFLRPDMVPGIWTSFVTVQLLPKKKANSEQMLNYFEISQGLSFLFEDLHLSCGGPFFGERSAHYLILLERMHFHPAFPR